MFLKAHKDGVDSDDESRAFYVKNVVLNDDSDDSIKDAGDCNSDDSAEDLYREYYNSKKQKYIRRC